MKRCYQSLLAFFAFALGQPLAGQSVLHGIKDGAWYPVMDIKGRHPMLFTGDDVARGAQESLALLPTAEFGEGFANVDVLTNSREGVTYRDGLPMFSSDRAWYTMKARIVSEVDLADCYFALRFDVYGEASYYCRAIGDLEAGKPAFIQIFMKVGYEMPQQLHLFSGMDEIRTTLVPTYYSYDYGQFALASK